MVIQFYDNPRAWWLLSIEEHRKWKFLSTVVYNFSYILHFKVSTYMKPMMAQSVLRINLKINRYGLQSASKTRYVLLQEQSVNLKRDKHWTLFCICKTISAKTRPKVLLNSSDKISNPKMKFDILVVTSFLKRKVCHLVSFSYSSFLYENQENWHEVLHSCFPTMFSINVISNI